MKSRNGVQEWDGYMLCINTTSLYISPNIHQRQDLVWLRSVTALHWPSDIWGRWYQWVIPTSITPALPLLLLLLLPPPLGSINWLCQQSQDACSIMAYRWDSKPRHWPFYSTNSASEVQIWPSFRFNLTNSLSKSNSWFHWEKWDH